ncbi:hypothetical protein [Pseudovibrio ascidiaceicola]|uniref:hypothetical protein n=1 Tax=Pseudovibrio ascidiaceicola TaxID=285279 RepID=UPI001114125B|nr:hypothetical protein [Pseudovibrio ascidiaceicola]
MSRLDRRVVWSKRNCPQLAISSGAWDCRGSAPVKAETRSELQSKVRLKPLIGEVGTETAIAVQAEGRIRPNDRLPSRDRSSIEHAVRGGEDVVQILPVGRQLQNAVNETGVIIAIENTKAGMIADPKQMRYELWLTIKSPSIAMEATLSTMLPQQSFF